MPLILLDKTVPTMISPSTGLNKIMRNFTKFHLLFILSTTRMTCSISRINFTVLDFHKVIESDTQSVFWDYFV